MYGNGNPKGALHQFRRNQRLPHAVSGSRHKCSLRALPNPEAMSAHFESIRFVPLSTEITVTNTGAKWMTCDLSSLQCLRVAYHRIQDSSRLQFNRSLTEEASRNAP